MFYQHNTVYVIREVFAMKFKKLSEAFDYDQAALNHAKDLIDELSAFIDNIDMYKHATECIDTSGIDKLNDAVDTLENFIMCYNKIAKASINAYYNKEV